jgi:hypothetical protein
METGKGSLPPSLIGMLHQVELNRSGWWRETLEKIVLWRLAEVDRPQHDAALRRGLSADLGIQVEPTQFKGVLDSLVENDALLVDPASGGYVLSEQSRQSLRGRESEMYELEAKVSRVFSESLASVGCVLPPAEIFEDFQHRLLRPLIRQLGARTYSILTGEGLDSAIEKTSMLREMLDAIVEDQRMLVRDAITRFLDPVNPEVRRWVLGRLHAQLLVLATNLDHDSLDSLSLQEGKKTTFNVLLDTNFLFSALALHVNPSNEAAAYLLDLIDEIKDRVEVRLLVLPQTIREAENALRQSRNAAAANGLITPEIAEAALRSTVLPGLVAHFYERVIAAKQPMDVESYFRPFVNGLEILLKDKGIEIIDDDMADILAARQSVQNEIGEIAAREKSKARPKGAASILHDVVFWSYVKEKRRRTSVLSDLEYWGISVDFAGMLTYDREKRRVQRQPPCVVHPSQFIQMLQFWVPRNDKLEEALLSSARLPLMFADFDVSTQKVTLKIIAELARYAEDTAVSVDSAMKILQNEVLRQRVDPQESEERTQEKLKSTLLDIVGDMEKRHEEDQFHVRELEEENRRLSQIDSERQKIEDGKIESKRQVQIRLERTRQEKDKLERQLTVVKKQRADVQKKFRELELWREEANQKLEGVEGSRRIAFVAIFCAAAIACLFCAFLVWDVLVNSTPSARFWRGSIVCTVAALICLVICYPFAKKFSVADPTWWPYVRIKSACVLLTISVLGAFLGSAFQFSFVPPP